MRQFFKVYPKAFQPLFMLTFGNPKGKWECFKMMMICDWRFFSQPSLNKVGGRPSPTKGGAA